MRDLTIYCPALLLKGAEMNRIYRVNGLQSAGTASNIARAISAINSNLRVRVDTETGTVDVRGNVNDYLIAQVVKNAGCDYLGPADEEGWEIPDH